MAANAPSLAKIANHPRELPSPLAKYREALWYAVYTSANHEKRVAEQLGVRNVPHFLPLYKSVRQWKDRRVELKVPLFPGYLFARIALLDRLCVQQVPGVVQLVGFGGMPTALPEGQIDVLRAALESGVRAEPHPFLRSGRYTRIKAGPLAGLQGILVRRKNQARFVLSVELIQRSVLIEIEEAHLEPA
jgi:transcription antitermination factor NusG